MGSNIRVGLVQKEREDHTSWFRYGVVYEEFKQSVEA